MTEKEDIMFILGELKGMVGALITSQSSQDVRISTIEERLNALYIKVALIGAAIGGGAGYFAHLIHP